MRDLGTTWKSGQFTFPEAKGSEQTHWKIKLGPNFGRVSKLTLMDRQVGVSACDMDYPQGCYKYLN